MNISMKSKLALVLVFILFAVQTADISMAQDEPDKIPVLELADEDGFLQEDEEPQEGTEQIEERSDEDTEKDEEQESAGDENTEETEASDDLGFQEGEDDKISDDEADLVGEEDLLLMADSLNPEAHDTESLLAAVAEAAGAGSVTILITEDILLNETVKISDGTDIVLIPAGGSKVIRRTEECGNFMFSVVQEGKLTLAGSENGSILTLDYGTDENARRNNRSVILYCAGGTVIFSEGVLTGLHSVFRDSAALWIDSDAAVVMSGGWIQANSFRNGYCSPVVIKENGRFEMSGGRIQNNSAGNGGQVTSGAVLMTGSVDGAKSRFLMTGGTITNNSGFYGGVSLYGDSFRQGNVFRMTGGTISHNTGDMTSLHSCGGVSVMGNAEFYMEGGIIEHNMAAMGGGVGVYDGGNGPVYKDYFPAVFQMDGGIIRYNHAGSPENITGSDVTEQGCGGGIYTASYNARINKGQIYGNTATEQGGGVYVGAEEYSLQLGAAVVTENKAVDSGRRSSMVVGVAGSGGGVWLCHTGTLKIGATGGIAVFDNDAEISGSDLYSVPKKDGTASYVTASKHMLGGGFFNWIRDICGSSSNHNPSSGESDDEHQILCLGEHAETYEDIELRTGALSLKSNPEEEAKAAAQAAAAVFVTGNTAPRGGGIASNGQIYTGEDKLVDLEVIKLWKEETDAASSGQEDRPESITVMLKTRNGHLLQEVTFSGDDNFRHTFSQLPDYGSGYYTVEEKVPEGYEAEYSSLEWNDETGCYVITITNTPEDVDPGEESGGGGGSKSKTGGVRLVKYTEDGETPLAGAVFALYDSGGRYLSSHTTSADGLIRIAGLSFGAYYLVETKAPAGYELDGTPIHFIISKTAAIELKTVNSSLPDWKDQKEGGNDAETGVKEELEKPDGDSDSEQENKPNTGSESGGSGIDLTPKTGNGSSLILLIVCALTGLLAMTALLLGRYCGREKH